MSQGARQQPATPDYRLASRACSVLAMAGAVTLGVVAGLPRTPGLASAVLGGMAGVAALVAAVVWRSARPR